MANKKPTTSLEVYVTDRDKVEKLKRKYKHKSNKVTVNKMIKIMDDFKPELEELK